MNEIVTPHKMAEVLVVTSYDVHSCGGCAMFYKDYKQLLAHLYWRHGTESKTCNKCLLRKWSFAAHICGILPIEELLVLEDFPSPDIHCTCKLYLEGESMIGCDGPECQIQWYHFKCVEITTPPDGEWFCNDCRHQNIEQNKAEICK